MRPLVDEVARAIAGQDLQAYTASLRRLTRAARDTATPAELTAVIRELVPLLRTANGISTELAVLAGGCVEWGGSPVPLSEVLPSRAVTAMLAAGHAARNGRPAGLYRTVATSWFDVMDWIKPMITCMARRAFRPARQRPAVTARPPAGRPLPPGRRRAARAASRPPQRTHQQDRRGHRSG